MDPGFDPFFNPRGVVLIGASGDPRKLGHGIARNLTTNGYAGAVHFVNQKPSGLLFGRDVHSSLREVPDPVDLAVILVPAVAVPEILLECGRRGILAAILASGGFREAGSAGADLESRCVRVAAGLGMRLMGPNCIGTIDTHAGFNSTFLAPPGPEPGSVAFVSHSGAICAAVIDWSAPQGIGFSRIISLGNQADLNETDALRMVAQDPNTKVVTLYLETVTDGRAFVDQAKKMKQPIVALKVGRHEGGRRAVVSHTGALAGREEAYRAAARRAGVVQAPTLEAMFDAARALAWAPPAPGRRTAVLTNAGGPGVMAADAVESAGLCLAELTAATRSELAGFLPDGASLANPVDMLASAAPTDFSRSLDVLRAAPEVDAVLVVFAPPPMFDASDVVEAVVTVVESSSKPVVVTVMGARTVGPAIARLREARIPDFRFPERAAAGLAVLADRAEVLAEPAGPARPLSVVDRESVAAVLDVSPTGWLEATTVETILTAYGISLPSARVATSGDDAVRAATAVGRPVAMKIHAPETVHKSEVGGVQLNLSSDDEIRSAFEALTARPTASSGPTGVYVQSMVVEGQDLIVGGVRDRQFGPLVMFGSGGVEVEGLGDVEFALAPLTRSEIDYLLANTWAGRRLRGHRNIPPGDVDAVEDVLNGIGSLLADHSRIAEIEINPVRVRTPGSGAIALDARVRID